MHLRYLNCSIVTGKKTKEWLGFSKVLLKTAVSCLIPNFGVSRAIWNTTDISSGWYKLNFGLLRDQVKSSYFLERIDARRQYFCFFKKLFGIIDRKRLGQPFWIMIWIYHYLLNQIKLGLDLDNPCWIREIPNFARNNINIWFFTHQT